MSDTSEMNPHVWAYDKTNFMSGTFVIPKTYKVTKKDLTLEDITLIIRALEIGISDTHPLFEQAKQQGLIDVPI